MIALSEAVRNARLSVIGNALDGGTGAGTLTLYSGVVPSPGAAVTTQKKLAALTFADPAAASVTGGVLTFDAIAEVMAVADGGTTWARAADSAGTWAFDGDVGAIGSGAFIEIDNLLLYTGGIVRVTVGQISEPQ